MYIIYEYVSYGFVFLVGFCLGLACMDREYRIEKKLREIDNNIDDSIADNLENISYQSMPIESKINEDYFKDV